MNDLNSAALTLGGVSLVWILIVFAVWWMRRPKPEPAAYAAPKAPREFRMPGLPSLSRKAEPEVETVEIAPSRLARVSGNAPLQVLAPETADPWAEAADTIDAAPASAPEPEPEPAAEYSYTPAAEPEPAFEDFPAAPAALDEAILESLVAEVAEKAHAVEEPVAVPPAAKAFVRLVQQIPPRDAILRKSWIGGRPHLPADMEWPRIDGQDGDFLAQIACADFPADLWDGLGPRIGALAFFANPDTGAATAVHLPEDGPPRDPPRSVGPAYFRPWRIDTAELAPFATRAFPEWPVDLVPAQPGEAAGTTDDAEALFDGNYDIADPAFHPFDWGTMLAMAEILENRMAKLPVDGAAPDDASDELAQAIAEAAEINREAQVRASEIVDIIHESAGQGVRFAPADATAVLAGLHSIRWASVTTEPDPESGEDRVEATTLPLTRHHPTNDLWVDAYRAVLFDRLKHAYTASPDSLSPAARAVFEPLWDAMAARETASMGHFPTRLREGFDAERDVALLELPASGLRSIGPRNESSLILAIRKADLAAGDFSKMRALAGN
ncbi:MAG: DUF1963 domain-containing protein [Sphingopyxis sp.]|nr:DUF1963 domain-containing protein [Sphingopyxis sp.]